MTTTREALLALKHFQFDCWCNTEIDSRMMINHSPVCLMAQKAIAAEEVCECGKISCFSGPLLVTVANLPSDKCEEHPGIPRSLPHWRCGTPKGERCEKVERKVWPSPPHENETTQFIDKFGMPWTYSHLNLYVYKAGFGPPAAIWKCEQCQSVAQLEAINTPNSHHRSCGAPKWDKQ